MAPLPELLRQPGVVERAGAVERRVFAEGGEIGTVWSLEPGEDGTVLAVGGAGAAWFDRDGETVRSLRFEVGSPLRRVRAVGGADGVLGFVGVSPEDAAVVLVAPEGSVRQRIGGAGAGRPLAVGDVGADGEVEIVTRLDRRCGGIRLCTDLAVFDLSGALVARTELPSFLTGLAVIREGERSGEIVVLGQPGPDGGSRFEVRDGELSLLAAWNAPAAGAVSLAVRDGVPSVVVPEGDAVVFRDLRGRVIDRLALPAAGHLRSAEWRGLPSGREVVAVSGFQSPRYLLALFDSGERTYLEVGSPHAEDVLVPRGGDDLFLVAEGGTIAAYTVGETDR